MFKALYVLFFSINIVQQAAQCVHSSSFLALTAWFPVPAFSPGLEFIAALSLSYGTSSSPKPLSSDCCCPHAPAHQHWATLTRHCPFFLTSDADPWAGQGQPQGTACTLCSCSSLSWPGSQSSCVANLLCSLSEGNVSLGIGWREQGWNV